MANQNNKLVHFTTYLSACLATTRVLWGGVVVRGRVLSIVVEGGGALVSWAQRVKDNNSEAKEKQVDPDK